MLCLVSPKFLYGILYHLERLSRCDTNRLPLKMNTRIPKIIIVLKQLLVDAVVEGSVPGYLIYILYVSNVYFAC